MLHLQRRSSSLGEKKGAKAAEERLESIIIRSEEVRSSLERRSLTSVGNMHMEELPECIHDDREAPAEFNRFMSAMKFFGGLERDYVRPPVNKSFKKSLHEFERLEHAASRKQEFKPSRSTMRNESMMKRSALAASGKFESRNVLMQSTPSVKFAESVSYAPKDGVPVASSRAMGDSVPYKEDKPQTHSNEGSGLGGYQESFKLFEKVENGRDDFLDIAEEVAEEENVSKTKREVLEHHENQREQRRKDLESKQRLAETVKESKPILAENVNESKQRAFENLNDSKENSAENETVESRRVALANKMRSSSSKQKSTSRLLQNSSRRMRGGSSNIVVIFCKHKSCDEHLEPYDRTEDCPSVPCILTRTLSSTYLYRFTDDVDGCVADLAQKVVTGMKGVRGGLTPSLYRIPSQKWKVSESSNKVPVIDVTSAKGKEILSEAASLLFGFPVVHGDMHAEMKNFFLSLSGLPTGLLNGKPAGVFAAEEKGSGNGAAPLEALMTFVKLGLIYVPLGKLENRKLKGDDIGGYVFGASAAKGRTTSPDLCAAEYQGVYTSLVAGRFAGAC